MLPFIFDWHWTIDRILFMGLLYLALAIIGLGLVIAFGVTWHNLKHGGGHGHHGGAHAEAEH